MPRAETAETIRAQALELIKLARLIEDPDLAGQIEAIAVSMLKQATEMERDWGF